MVLKSIHHYTNMEGTTPNNIPTTSSEDIPTTSSEDIPTTSNKVDIQTSSEDTIPECILDTDAPTDWVSLGPSLFKAAELTKQSFESLKGFKVIDNDEHLTLYSYHIESKQSPPPMDNELQQQCRGMIFDNSGRLVMKSFGYTLEYNETQRPLIQDRINRITNEDIRRIILDIATNKEGWVNTYTIDNWFTDPNVLDLINTTVSRLRLDRKYFTNVDVYNSYEGCLIRVFYYQPEEGKDRWYISTNRKLDAFKSKWSCESSFGQLFVRALEALYATNTKFKKRINCTEGDTILDKFLNILDKDKKYLFLLKNNPDNRIVCDLFNNDHIYHVGTYTHKNGLPYWTLDMTVDCNVPYPEKLPIKNLDDLIKHVTDLDVRKLQGVIVYLSNGLQFKVIPTRYQQLFLLRDNNPNLRQRYLELRRECNTEEGGVIYDRFLDLYRSHKDEFNRYEKILNTTAQEILNTYIRRHIRKEQVILSPTKHKIAKQCHEWYMANRPQRVTLDVVKGLLNKADVSLVYSILNEHLKSPLYPSAMNSKEECVVRDEKVTFTDIFNIQGVRKTYSSIVSG